MKKLPLLFALLLLLCRCSGSATPLVIEGYGDLYVIHLPEDRIRIVAADSLGQVLDTTLSAGSRPLRLHYFAADSLTPVNFQFTLHPPFEPEWKLDRLPPRVLVLSDLHGRLDAFTALLEANGVVDGRLHWSYGTGHLVYVGDVLDRGREDNGIFWLLYKLEQEARQAGGTVHFLPGNHEDLVLKNDLRYVHPAYLAFAERAGISYSELYGSNSELGRWIRHKNMVLLMDDQLFVHAGLSKEMMDNGYTFEEMNELTRRYIGFPTRERAEMHPRNVLFFGTAGPLWYRGLVFDTEKHPGISSEDLEEILRHYGIERIIVGHSEVDEVEFRYRGRVIPVNVRHHRNYPDNRSGALLIENGQFYSVDYTGRKSRLVP